MFRGFILFLPLLLAVVALTPPPAVAQAPLGPWPPTWRDRAIRAADYILRCQDASGAIRDALDSPAVNMDNNMGYALAGLAAAYQATGGDRYLAAMKRGLSWLASVQEPDGAWHWGYRAATDRPFVGDAYRRLGITDIKGIDAIQAYFAYTLFLYISLSGDEEFARTAVETARRGIEYLIANNYDGRFFYSSWQERNGRWNLFPQQYSAGQGDVYLGLLALARLTGEERYAGMAGRLRRDMPVFLIDGAWATGRWGRTPYRFSNGYLPYILKAPEGLDWLAANQNGTAIAAAALAVGQQANGRSPAAALASLERLQGSDGGVGFSGRAPYSRYYYTNDAAFAILGWVGAPFAGFPASAR